MNLSVMAQHRKESFERVLAQCENLTGIKPVKFLNLHASGKDFFEFILELVLAQCSNLALKGANLTGLIH